MIEPNGALHRVGRCGRVDFVPLTTGLVTAAAVCTATAGWSGLVLLRAAAGQPAIRRACRLVTAATATAAVGVVGATVVAGLAHDAGRSTRLHAAAVVDAGYAVTAVLLVTGLLFVPGLAASRRARLRRVLDGVILAACVFFASWILAIEPAHERALRARPDDLPVGGGCLAVAVPSLVAFAVLGVLTVTVWEAAPPRRVVLVTCAGAALTGAGAVALTVAVLFAPDAVPAGAAVYAASLIAVAVAVRHADRLRTPVPERAAAGFGISVTPVALALVAALVQFVFFDGIDRVGVFTGAGIVAAVAFQQGLARIELRRYADRVRESETHFRVMAHTDALTGLGNRRELLRTLHADAIGGPPCVLLLLDLDGFKNVNDVRGHDVGDAVLIEVADRLRSNLRPGDVAARLGGDEFAVLMWAGPREAAAVADRLLVVLGRPYELPTGTVFLSASIGLAGCATAESVETLLRNADLALRFAKQHGKGRVEEYDLAYEQLVRRRTELEHELRGAVERGELMLAYQPIVALPEGRVAGVEALLRWHHPTLGIVPPDEFIPLAEEAGLIEGLGAFVLHDACHQLSRWVREGHELYLAVNVSVRELHTPEYASRVAEVLRLHHLASERLVVEVTEHAVALDVERLVSRLAALREAGVRVALDDFGSGYSSLGQLRTLPVDILKIDRSLLAPPEDAVARFVPPLVDVVVRLGNRLDLDVVAEGITEPAQRRVLEEAGCRYAQGDLFSRALPAERVEPLFDGHPFEAPSVTLPAQNVGPVDSAHEMRKS